VRERGIYIAPHQRNSSPALLKKNSPSSLLDEMCMVVQVELRPDSLFIKHLANPSKVTTYVKAHPKQLFI